MSRVSASYDLLITFRVYYFEIKTMKKNTLLISFLLIVISCDRNSMIENVVGENPTETRSLHPDGFDDNWENRSNITLTNGAVVELPWVRSAVTDIPVSVREDIKKEDGWTFVKTSNTDLGSDYMIFYNKYSGLLKVFYYNNSSVINNNALWVLYDQSKVGFLNQGTYFTSPIGALEQESVAVSPTSLSSTLGVGRGWNCFQYPITYTGKSGYIDILQKNLSTSNITLTGSYTDTTDGTIIQKSTTESKTKDIASSAAKAVGEKGDSWVKQTLGKTHGILQNASSVIGGLVGGGVTSLVGQGLNVLFGSFLGHQQKDVPIIQTVELSTTGKLSSEGTIVTPGTGLIPPLSGINAEKMGAWNIDGAYLLVSTSHVKAWAVDYPSYPVYNKEILAEYYNVRLEPHFKVIVNPDIEDEVDIKTKANLVIFEGLGWDSVFCARNGNIKPNYNYCHKLYTYSDYDNRNKIAIYQGDNLEEAEDQSPQKNKAIAWNSGAYETKVNIRNPFVDCALDPRVHRSFENFCSDIYRYLKRMEIGPTIDINLKKEDFGNYVRPDGTLVSYFGNIGLNVEVTMTVKETGKNIISSRTYPTSLMAYLY